MKVLRLVFATLAIGVVSIPAAQARDSFSIGLNFGSPYYYAPPVQYYSPPPVVYYPSPPVYYYGAPRSYYYQPAPQASFGYWNGGGRGGEHGWGHHGHHGHHDHDDDD